jgi:hypothetical protein
MRHAYDRQDGGSPPSAHEPAHWGALRFVPRGFAAQGDASVTLYIVGSPRQATSLLQRMRADSATRTTPLDSAVLVAGTAEEMAQARAAIKALRADLGGGSVRVLDLRRR